jgi:hypothetical protein
MVAKRALLGDAKLLVDGTNAVRTGIDAVLTADALVAVDQDHAVI